MMTREENDRLCRIGPGTPMGALFRRFWLPICSAIARGNRSRRGPGLRLPFEAPGHMVQKSSKPDRQPGTKPIHRGWRTRYRVHAQGHAPGVPRSLNPVPWDASLHPRSDQRPRLQNHRNSSEPSTAPTWRQQIQFRKSGAPGHHRYVWRSLAPRPANQIRNQRRKQIRLPRLTLFRKQRVPVARSSR